MEVDIGWNKSKEELKMKRFKKIKDDRPFGLNNRVNLGRYGNIYYGLQLKD